MPRPQPSLRATAAALVALVIAPQVTAQLAPPASTEEALQRMSDAAGIIFTGTITAIHRPASSSFVEIDFAVTDAIRGVSSPTFTLREWAGLWTANDQPLRPGARYLMFLHTPNAHGLTAPVGGPDGAIPIHGASPAATPESSAPVAASALATSASAPSDNDSVDLGWIATEVAVPLTYARSASANPISSHPAASTAEPSPAVSAEPPATLPPVIGSVLYTSLIHTLRIWEAAHAASR